MQTDSACVCIAQQECLFFELGLLKQYTPLVAWPGVSRLTQGSVHCLDDRLTPVAPPASAHPPTQSLLTACCEILITAESDLNALDAKSGDGDTGSTLAGAALSLIGAVDRLPLADHPQLLRAIGLELSQTMGGCPARSALRKGRPLEAASPAAAKKIASKTPEVRSPVPSGGRWDLMVIVSAKRHGTKNSVVAQLLASDNVEQVAFTCHSEEPIFEVDDFVSRRAGIYSFFDKKTLSTLTFKEGGWVHKSEDAPPRPVPPPAPPLPARRPSPRLAIDATPTAAAKSARTYDMTRQEMAHFHSKKKSVQQLCEELLPVVRAYAREGDRKPRDVAARLNREGRRTLLGSRWTPRLAYFLLGLIFMPAESTTTEKDSEWSDGPKETPAPSGPMTSEEVARRLSKLGRVVLSGPE